MFSLFRFRPAHTAALFLPVISSLAMASEETPEAVVVTATRVAQPVSQVIGSVTVITRQDIEQRQATSVQDLLRGEAGIDVSNNGGPGKASSIFLRGANAAQTLILMDGVRLGSATAGTTSIEYLPVDQIERIEIVRGPRSSLYGADAVGGVIQIFTRKNQGVNASVTVGSQNLQTYSAGFGLQQQALRVSVQGSYQQTDGIDAQGYNDAFNFSCFCTVRVPETDLDGYRNTNASARVGYAFGQIADLELSTLYSQGLTNYDGSFVNQTRFINSAPTARLRITPNEALTISVEGGITSDRNDNLLNNVRASTFNTEKRNGNLQGEWRFTADQTVTAGFDYLNDVIDSDTNYAIKQRINRGVYAQYLASFGNHRLNASVRTDDNEQFGRHETGSAGWKWLIAGDQLAVNAGLGTAFHTPTFNDLYYPFGFGNPDLKPETSRSYELGASGRLSWLDQSLLDWSLQTYQTDADDLIVLDQNFRPVNVSKARLRGAELTLNTRWQDWHAALTYSAQSPLSRMGGSNFDHLLPRRTRSSGRVELGYDFGQAQIATIIQAGGQRYDDLANRTRLPGYATVDFRADIQLHKQWQLQTRIGNFLDRQYRTAAAYNQEGRTLVVTLRYRY